MYYYWLPLPWVGTVAGKPFPKEPCDAAVDTLYELLRAAGLAARHTRRPDLGWLADDVDALLSEAGVKPGFVQLIPGCSARHLEKRWPYYAELAQRLAAEGAQVVMAPGPDEIELCRSIPGIALFDAGKPLSVFQLVGLSRRAGFVIGNDTGPSHIAAHTGAKGLALFGAGVHASATYIDRRFAVIEVPDLKQLSVDRVFDAYKAELAHAPR
jgi:ADP-heptose:LPS heptosyltransferase